ncbi:MAG: class I SAM-dependent methyltransferase [Proteobacteria bacterium]|nr:class I SAM-dependent methyltransferase [Pseudomonadota bacterium]
MKNILNSKPTNNVTLENEKLYKNIVDDLDLKDKTILDLGCGFGWFCLIAEKKGAQKIYGIEISDEDLQTAKNHIKSKKIEFKIGSAIHIPLPDSSIDTIFSWEVIEHIPENKERKMIEEIERVLKPGGKCYLSTPYNSFISKLFDPAFIVLKHRHYDEKHFQKFVKGTKMKIENITAKGRFWYLLDLINLYFSKWVLRREKLFEMYMLKKRINEFKNSKKKGYMALYVKLCKQN